MKRICEFCGKEYDWVRGKSKRFCCKNCIQNYNIMYPEGKEREFICENCGKEYNVNPDKGNWDKDNNQIVVKGSGAGNFVVKSSRFCCYECGQIKEKEKSKETFLKRYGVDHPSKSNECKIRSNKLV